MSVSVSVIIPVYNRQRYVVQSLESVLAQTYRDYEIVVVDDGSTDGTREVLEPYMNRIRYFYQANAGASAARNKGVQESEGAYLAFLDSDDMWEPEKLEKQIQYVQDDETVCFHQVSWFVEPGMDEGLLRRSNDVIWPKCDSQKYIADPVLAVAKRHHLPMPSLMCSKKCFLSVGFFHKEVEGGEDVDWFFRAAMTMRFRFLPENLATVRLHDSQTGMASRETVKAMVEVFRRMRERTKAKHREAYRISTELLAKKVSELANIEARAGQRWEGAKLSLRAFALAPEWGGRLVKAGMILAGWKPKI